MVLKWPQLYSLLNEWRNFDNVEGGDLLCNKQLVNFLVCVDPNILGPYQFIVQNLSDSFERERESKRRRERIGEREECRVQEREIERDGGKKERERGEVKRYRGRDFREKDRDSNKKELAVVFCMNMM